MEGRTTLPSWLNPSLEASNTAKEGGTCHDQKCERFEKFCIDVGIAKREYFEARDCHPSSARNNFRTVTEGFVIVRSTLHPFEESIPGREIKRGEAKDVLKIPGRLLSDGSKKGSASNQSEMEEPPSLLTSTINIYLAVY